MVKIVNSAQEFNEVINSNQVVINMFGTRPCPMCERVEAIFDDISNTFNQSFVYSKLVIAWSGSSNDIRNIPYRLGVRVAPALCVIKNGKMINYLIEFISKEQMIDWINKTL